MKKRILFLLFPIIGSLVGFTQTAHIGVSGGMAISRGSYEPSEGLDRRVFAGFDGGALLEIGTGSKIMVQPEVNFSIIGVEINDGEKEATIKLRYVTIPVLVKLSVSKNVNLFAGPQLGFLLSAKRDSSFTNETIDLDGYFKRNDFGLVAGVEYNFGKHIFLGTRYYYGLHQVAENWNNFEMKNRYISFRLGLKL